MLAPDDGTVPILKPGLRISPFTEAGSTKPRHLVEIEHQFYVVDERAYQILCALGERPATFEAFQANVEGRLGASVARGALREVLTRRLPAELFEGAASRHPLSPFTFKVPLLPEPLAAGVSSRLTWLFAKPIVVPMMIAFAVVVALLGPRAFVLPLADTTPWQLLAAGYAAALAGTFFHEFGHAAACRRYHCPHGEIGFALYLLYPAFYTDVSRAWRLAPSARAVVDAGGIYFQAILVTLVGSMALWTGNRAFDGFIVVMLFSILYTLNPAFKMDGYWLLTDLSGLTNLHKQMGDMVVHVVRRTLRRPSTLQTTRLQYGILAAYTLLAGSYVGLIAFYVLWFAAASLADLPHRFSAALAATHAASAAGVWPELRSLWDLVLIVGAPLVVGVLLGFVLVRFARAVRPFARRVG